MGVDHLGHHEKTDGAWTPETARLLSVCCCAACRRAWLWIGLDPAEVVAALRAGTPSGAMLDALLAIRHRHTDLLRAQVLAALPSRRSDRTDGGLRHSDRAALPSRRSDRTDGGLRHSDRTALPVTLHAHPDPWATGPSPGLTAAAADDVDALLVPCWPPGADDLVRQAASRGRPIDAYVTLLHPMDPDALVPHVLGLKAAGASRFSLYHLGLAPAWRQGLFATIAAAVE